MTASPGPGRPDPTEPTGPLSRASTVAYWFLVLEGLLVLTTAPGLVPLFLLAPDASNIPLAALLLVPVGPAVSAAFFAWRTFDGERDQSPARHFWRGYRLNVLDALRVWIPGLLVLAVLAVNLTHLGAVELPLLVGTIGGLVAVVVVAWLAHALVVASGFSFRYRDVARMAAYFVFAKPLVSLGAVSYAVLAAGVVIVASDWVLVLLASVFTFLLWRNARPLVAEVMRRFVVDAPEAVVATRWRGLEGVARDPADDEPADEDGPEADDSPGDRTSGAETSP